MAEEKREGPPDKEVEEILNDLEAILSDLGAGPGPSIFTGAGDTSAALAGVEGLSPAAAKQTPSVPPAKPPAPAIPAAPAAKLAPVIAPAVPPAPAIPAAPAAKPAPAVAPAMPPAPAAKPPSAPAAPKPGAAAPPPWSAAPSVPRPAPALPSASPVPPAPKPASMPAPSTPGALPAAPERPDVAAAARPGPAQRGLPPAAALPDIPEPEKLGKDQIRRVAYLYLGKFEAERDALAKLLDQTAQTVPKKPLFLRRVLYQALAEDYDGKELLARVLQSKAVAALGIVEGLSEARLRGLAETLGGGGVMFRSVAPLDAGKKSVAIDIVVDVMLLPAEAP